jgi:hypothetical protein
VTLWACGRRRRRGGVWGGAQVAVSGGDGMSFASLRRFWAGGGEEELVVGASRSSQSEAVEAQDAPQVGEQHLDLLSLPP